MPPRPAKKSPAKKPSAKEKKPASASESTPVHDLPSVAEEKTPEPEALSTLRDRDASEADAISGDAIVEGEAPPSTAMVEEPDEPIGEDSNTESDSEESLEDEAAELEGEESGDAVARMEVDEGVKEAIDKVNNRDEIEYEATGPDDAEGGDDDDDCTSDADVDNEENEDNDHTLDMQAAVAEGKKQKESEIFVGGLDKGAVEDDLIKVFEPFGDVQSARIVRHPTTKKSKGFAFIRFADSEHAMKAISELKDGIEIKGKHVRIQASQDNATLYLGNISKIWTRDNVIERLKNFGVEQIDNMILPEDPKNEGKIKGFAFLEFSSHSDAILAFKRLRKPDADFGRDKSAKVAFAHTSLHPSEDDMLQVKTVYFEGIPSSWDEEKVKEICKEYGEIEKVLLSRNFSSRKRKDFGFVEFSSRESALACVEGINKAPLVDGDVKVTANLARPVNKGRLSKQGSKGGFKAKKDGETNEDTGSIKKKRKANEDTGSIKKKKRKANSEEILPEEMKHNTKNAKQRKPSTSQNRDSKGKSSLQTSMNIKRKKGSGKAMDTYASGRPSKKMRQNRNYGNVYNRNFNGFGNRNSTYSAIPEARYGAPTTAYPASYKGYAYAAASEPQPHPSDLVPHAGYLPALKQSASTYEYDRRRSGTYNNEIRGSFGSGRGMPASYQSDYSSYQPAGYRHRSSGAYAPRGPYY